MKGHEATRPVSIDEMRSHMTQPTEGDLPSDTPPCSAPSGHSWVHAFSPTAREVDPLTVGKWLIRVQCQFVNYCWGRVRAATEEGSLGIQAKVSTDWHNANDPAGEWGRMHVVCIYTRDWHDRGDVLRVAGRLREIDAVRRSVLYYKPDIETYSGRYAGNDAGMVSIFEARVPYDRLTVRPEALAQAEELLVAFARSFAADPWRLESQPRRGSSKR